MDARIGLLTGITKEEGEVGEDIVARGCKGLGGGELRRQLSLRGAVCHRDAKKGCDA